MKGFTYPNTGDHDEWLHKAGYEFFLVIPGFPDLRMNVYVKMVGVASIWTITLLSVSASKAIIQNKSNTAAPDESAMWDNQSLYINLIHTALNKRATMLMKLNLFEAWKESAPTV